MINDFPAEDTDVAQRRSGLEMRLAEAESISNGLRLSVSDDSIVVSLVEGVNFRGEVCDVLIGPFNLARNSFGNELGNLDKLERHGA